MIALQKITTEVKTYKPGETLGLEFSEKDLIRLKKLKAIEGTDFNFNSDEELFGEDEPLVFLSESELNKFSNKAKLVEYACSIGLEELTTDLKKEELIDAILNYIEEIEANQE